MLRVLLIFYVVWLTSVVSGKKRSPDRNRACMNTVNHLKQQMEECHGMYFCGYYMGYGAHCIPNKEVCDGHSQCEGGEDEANCPPKSLKCQLNEMMCSDGKKCALPCNGIPECMGGIDELNCDIKCKSGEVQCSDGKCAVVGDGNTECEDGSDEDCPDQCKAGYVLCKHKTSGKQECVSTCDDTIECASDEDKMTLSTCPLVCPLTSIKCKLRNGRGLGCAPVCDKIQQCQDFDESLGTFTHSSPAETDDLCDEITGRCSLPAAVSPMYCFINIGFPDIACCGCNIRTRSGRLFVTHECRQNE